MMKKRTNGLVIGLGLGAMCAGLACCSPFVNTGQMARKSAVPPAAADTAHLEANPLDKVVDSHSLIVFYDPKVGREHLEKAIKEYGARVMYDYKNFSGMAIALPSGKNMIEAKQHFSKVKGVTQVNFNRIAHLDSDGAVQ